MGFKNIVVTGANGMLGSELVPFLRAQGYTVFPTHRDTLNLLETQDGLRARLEPYAPEIIIHTAAYTNVDGAEREPELAMAINKDGTQKLALVAQELGAILVYVSTDYVFDGLKDSPYEPSDRPNPINTYGLSKYYGELMVTELLDEAYIVRVSWLYGIHRNNFSQWVLDSARLGNTVRAATNWVGSPTWTGSVCTALERIMTSGTYGVYHACDQGVISRHDQAMAMCQLAGLPTTQVEPVHSRDLNLLANRPDFTPMGSPNLPMPTWETSFHAYLTQYQQAVSSLS